MGTAPYLLFLLFSLVMIQPTLSITSNKTLLRLFAAPKGGIEKLKPLQEQEGPNSSSFNDLEIMSSREIALQVFDNFSVF